jgi:hypothetical protein
MSSTTKTLNISLTKSSGKGKKGGSKSPSKGVNNSKTSIVDNLLKDRKSPSTIDGNKVSVGVGNINSKKLVLDLNSDNYIITESKSAQQAKADADNKAMPVKRISSPVIEPIILAAQEITRSGSPESTKGGKFKSPVPESSHGSEPSHSLESRDKLNIFKNIDSVLTERPAAKSITLDLESAGSSREPSPVQPSRQPRQVSEPAVNDLAETQRKLAEVQDNIAKINDKIKRKGPSEKYTNLLALLNGKVKKYTRILNTPTRQQSSQPTGPASPVPNIPPPTYKESAKHEIVKSPVRDEIDEELARARTLLQTPTAPIKSAPAKKPNPPIQSSQPSQKQVVQKDKDPVTKKKERNTVFDVGTSIDTLREKQTHLQEQQRKLQEEYAHRLKQIEKMKSQKAEIQKLQTLESERRKIYEMEQKLKSLEREQWKEQQALRKELHQINVRNLPPPPAIDRGELFSLKQELVARAVPAQVTSGGILTYLYDKWSAFTKIPMGEVIHLPKKSVTHQQSPLPAKSVPVSQVAEPVTIINVQKYAGRFVYLIDFPELEFTTDTLGIHVSNEFYIIPYDDTWLETYYRDICIDCECLSACSQSSDSKYIQENYKTRIATNLGLTMNNRAIEYYVNNDKSALAKLAMLYSLVRFYESNH